MAEIYLNSLASHQAKWLSVRQSLIASNIANANTPGYRAVDVKALDQSKNGFLNLVQTNAGHMSVGIANSNGVATQKDDSWEVYHSGGNVSLPREMLKSAEVSSDFQLVTTVMKSFHRMVLSIFGS